MKEYKYRCQFCKMVVTTTSFTHPADDAYGGCPRQVNTKKHAWVPA